MMRIQLRIVLLALVALLMPASVWVVSVVAKPAVLIPVSEAQKYLVPVSQLMRVDEGVFELEVGKTIDLTDRKLLLGISYRRRRECCNLTLNGDTIKTHSFVGKRFNLKRERSSASFVQDKDVCFLDVVDVALPKGAPGIFTFRLHCL